MMKISLLVTAALAALSLLAGDASAATDIGQQCPADHLEPDRTLLVAPGVPSPLIQPVTPAAPPQVITGWAVWVGSELGPQQQRLEVYRQLTGTEYRKEAESATETVRQGMNSFDARIPVNGTGYLALAGATGALACDSFQGAGYFEGSAAIGETRDVTAATRLGVPLVASVEPDLDADGYGDESQDGCPQSAALQIECPAVQARVASRKITERAVLVRVFVNAPAQVQVFGQVSWQVEQGGGRGHGLTAGISAGRPRKVGSGTTASFRLPLGKAVSRRLGRLTTKQSLRARITVATTDLAGDEKRQRLTVELPGRRAT